MFVGADRQGRAYLKGTIGHACTRHERRACTRRAQIGLQNCIKRLRFEIFFPTAPIGTAAD